MSEAKDIPPGNYKLELGSTFSENKKGGNQPQYHTLRYDFKPQSVASAESDTFLAYGGNSDVHVVVPTDGDNMTVFKGSKKEAKPKECLLFFNKKTGCVRLEKISSNIQVKKTRDVDKNMELALRNEMAKLRANRKPAGDSGLSEQLNTARDGDDSSSSSSSSGSDSDSDDEDTTRTAKRYDSTSSTEDMDTALLAEMGSSSAAPPPPPPPPSAPPPPPPAPLRDFDMPSFVAAPARAPPPPPPPAPHRDNDLGLNLSESSDDED